MAHSAAATSNIFLVSLRRTLYIFSKIFAAGDICPFFDQYRQAGFFKENNENPVARQAQKVKISQICCILALKSTTEACTPQLEHFKTWFVIRPPDPTKWPIVQQRRQTIFL